MPAKLMCVLTFSLFFSVGCDDGGSPSTPTPTPAHHLHPMRPAASVLTLGVDGPTTWTITSDSSSFICGDVSASFVLTESAGLAGTVVRSDAYVQWADGDIEGRRVQDRTVHIEASSAITLTVNRFECASKRNELPGLVVLKLNVRDDGGNEHDLEATSGNWERR